MSITNEQREQQLTPRERVERFLDERERPTLFAPRGFLPVDMIAALTRTGDALRPSDLRAVLAELDDAEAEATRLRAVVERVEAMASEWGKPDGHHPVHRLGFGADLRAALTPADTEEER